MATILAKVPTAEPKAAVSAAEMGARQRDISVSEFFTKNRHLLGFDNPRKALLTCVKEAVDNALDAAEEAGILPDVAVTLEVAPSNGDVPPPASQATRFRVTVTDNGPGIVRQQIPPIFAKLLYGSKFHRLRMSRGQQGIGISAAGMYAQLTTGKPVQIISRTSARAAAHYFEVQIDTKKNEPRIFESKKIDWEHQRGTQVTLEIEGRYQKGRASVDEFLEQVAIANPHVKLVYRTPEGDTREYPRTINELPPQPREIKPHPYGIEFGILLRMLHDTRGHSLSGFLAGGTRGAPRGGRAGGRRQRAGPRHSLRQPGPPALPAVGLRHLQGRARDRVAELRRVPVPGRTPDGPHGGVRPHGLGLGALHQRVQGSDRRLRRDPQGDQARDAGMRAAARRVPAAARAGEERVPPAQHLRALHRRGRGSLRPAQGRQAAQGEAQGPAGEDRHEAERW